MNQSQSPKEALKALPELPEPTDAPWVPARNEYVPMFTADQMRAYALAAIDQLGVPAEGWRPIGTAPKDKTAILVMRDIWPGTNSGRAEECNGHNTYVAEWWGTESGWVCYMDMIYDPGCPIEPTHWMPLPAAPKEPTA